MRRIIWFSLLLLWLLLTRPARAIVDPRQSQNNRVGIHVLEQEDLKPAAELVNTNGDWGYVTSVLRLNDLNQEKWQAIFDEMRRRHLIPILRLATTPENSYWAKPKSGDVDKLVGFLNSLNWVVQNRYVVLFNEPNHAKEWGNEIKPHEYAAIVKEFSTKLKAVSEDYFLLPAGLDTAAPNSKNTMAATEYWRQMYLADPEVFPLFDGWNSHSYPNPDFSGSVTGSGLGTIRSYLAEINYLSRFGLPANLPIFITETGWINTGGDLAGLYTTAFTQVWQQANLVAVTPFVLNYPQAPFRQFSWLGTPHYEAVAALPKAQGRPQQVNQSQLVDHNLPDEVVTISDYRFFLEWENLGQSIWEREDFLLGVTSNLAADSLLVGHLATAEPGQTARVDLSLKTGAAAEPINLQFQLKFQDKPFGEVLAKTITIVPPPEVILSAKLLLSAGSPKDQYRLLVYDADNNLLQENLVGLSLGRSEKVLLYSLVPNQAYRLVLLKPYYLPRQTWVVLNKGANQVSFKTLLPFDFDQSGHLSLADFWAWLLLPINYLRFGLQPGN